ncbi:MAG TPA: alpha/beta hydrolase [Polyangiaceae bacterium]|nr:alpha/beta hydrolase [Polyangiaceae bacterium]
MLLTPTFARLVAIALALVSASCSGFFYFPSRSRLEPDSAWFPRATLDRRVLGTPDGERLDVWLIQPVERPLRGTFVQFHGNAGHVGAHVRSLYWVIDHGFALLAFDYRGYGASSGRPSQRGLYVDALTVLKHVRDLPLGTSAQDVVLYGQSLGGAVLLRAFADGPRERVRALVVEGSFHSYEEIAASVAWRTPLLFPFGGFAYAAVSDEYSPSAFISRVAPTPLLVVHAASDPVIPVAFGRAIHALARQPKAFLELASDRHIGGPSREAQRAMLDWLDTRAPGHQLASGR